jgi:ElaB/YqjD/DUF883 family membrane-anchored ribosome-binding protein
VSAGKVSVSEIEPAPKEAESTASMLQQIASDYYQQASEYVRGNTGTLVGAGVLAGVVVCVLLAGGVRRQ